MKSLQDFVVKCKCGEILTVSRRLIDDMWELARWPVMITIDKAMEKHGWSGLADVNEYCICNKCNHIWERGYWIAQDSNRHFKLDE